MRGHSGLLAIRLLVLALVQSMLMRICQKVRFGTNRYLSHSWP